MDATLITAGVLALLLLLVVMLLLQLNRRAVRYRESELFPDLAGSVSGAGAAFFESDGGATAVATPPAPEETYEEEQTSEVSAAREAEEHLDSLQPADPPGAKGSAGPSPFRALSVSPSGNPAHALIAGMLGGQGELSQEEFRRLELYRPQKILDAVEEHQESLTGKDKERRRVRLNKIRQYALALMPAEGEPLLPEGAEQAADAGQWPEEPATDAETGDWSAEPETEAEDGEWSAGGDEGAEETEWTDAEVAATDEWSDEAPVDSGGSPEAEYAEPEGAEAAPSYSWDAEGEQRADVRVSWDEDEADEIAEHEPAESEAPETAAEAEAPAQAEPTEQTDSAEYGREIETGQSHDDPEGTGYLDTGYEAEWETWDESDDDCIEEDDCVTSMTVETEESVEVEVAPPVIEHVVEPEPTPAEDEEAPETPAGDTGSLSAMDVHIESAEDVMALPESERVDALSFLEPPELVRTLEASDDPELKRAVIDTLESTGTMEALHSLNECLEDPNPEIQLYALEATERLLAELE